jgi:hypothetical protein
MKQKKGSKSKKVAKSQEIKKKSTKKVEIEKSLPEAKFSRILNKIEVCQIDEVMEDADVLLFKNKYLSDIIKEKSILDDLD